MPRIQPTRCFEQGHASRFYSWNTVETRHTPLAVHAEETRPNGRLCRKLKSCSIYLDAACHMKEISIDSLSRWLGTTMQNLQCSVESESETSSASTHKLSSNSETDLFLYRVCRLLGTCLFYLFVFFTQWLNYNGGNYPYTPEFLILISQKVLINVAAALTVAQQEVTGLCECARSKRILFLQ